MAEQMADQPLTRGVLAQVLVEFHRDILAPDIRQILSESEARLRTEMHGLHDAVLKELDTLKIDNADIKIGLARVEERLDRVEMRLRAVEARLDSMEGRLDTMEACGDVLASSACWRWCLSSSR